MGWMRGFHKPIPDARLPSRPPPIFLREAGQKLQAGFAAGSGHLYF
jgi:hypothetical protein